MTLTWVTIALAQARDADGDSGDMDELSLGTLLVGAVVVAAIAWIVYRRGSTRPR
jgi:hypothetical protein